MTLLIALLSICISVAAQFCLKAGMSSLEVREAMAHPAGLKAVLAVFSNLYVLGGFMLYGLGAVVWLAVLSKWDVSKAYPLVGFGFALSVGVGAWLGEGVGVQRVAGVALICLGVFVVGKT